MSVFEAREEFLRRLKESRVVVVGFGLTGKAVGGSLKRLGLEPSLVDTREEEELQGLLEDVGALGVPVVWGAKARRLLQEADCVVVSPGVSLKDQFFAGLSPDAEIMSEIELAYRLAPCPIVAITGTNGKSTTTRLAGQILAAGGKDALVGGNIGEPLIEKALRASPASLLVAEVSSFQLEGCHWFRPLVAVLLNITADHLNRHQAFEEYVALKARVFHRQTPSEVAIGNLDDPRAAQVTRNAASRKYYFSLSPHQEAGAFIEKGLVWWQEKKERVQVCSTDGWRAPGAHNEENLLAAVAVGRVCGVEGEQIAAALSEFQLSEHTFEKVVTLQGVTYINDSKGTNPAATASALNAISGRVILIAGGSDKKLDFEALLEPLREKVRCLITLGETGEALRQLGEKAGIGQICKASDLPGAVRLASGLAQPGETVLFSPAAASFDMFRDYKQRGQAFKQAVEQLKK